MGYIIKKCNYLLFIIVIITGATVTSAAQRVEIADFQMTASTCQSNGTASIRVNVEDLGGADVVKILYKLDSDSPELGQAEAENVDNPYEYTFIGLAPAKYKVTVKVMLSTAQDITTDREFTITGKYQLPTITPAVKVPSLVACDTTGTGYVRVINAVGNVSVTITGYTGSASESPVGRSFDFKESYYSGTNSYDYHFRNLPSGEYEFRIQDDCYLAYRTLTMTTISFTSNQLRKETEIKKCVFHFKAKIQTNSYYIDEYYNDHKDITYQISGNGYISKKKPLGVYDTIPITSYSGTYNVDIFDPCGNVILNDSRVYLLSDYVYDRVCVLKNSPNYTCDTLALYIGNQDFYYGGRYRVLYKGNLIQDWKLIDRREVPFVPGEPFRNLYGRNYTVEIENPCGGTYSHSNVTVQTPKIELNQYDVYANYNCRTGKFDISVQMPTSDRMVMCLPSAYMLLELDTREEYSVTVYERDKTYWINDVPEGRYALWVRDDTGYETASIYITYITPKPYVSNTYGDECDEGKGHFVFSKVFNGYRIQLLSSPPGTSYYYDKIATMVNQTVYPDNGKSGIAGPYKFKVTDTCGMEHIIEHELTTIYRVNEKNLTEGSSDCNGLEINTLGTYVNADGATKNGYFEVYSYPAGYVKPPVSATGVPIKLTVPGQYIIGFKTRSSAYCALDRDTIYYKGSGVQVDLEKTLAFVCPDDPDTEGSIYVQAVNGQSPYTYYVSPAGQGGEGVIGDPSKYLAMNNHGDFTSENFPKGGIYDITIQDACRSVIVHQIKVGDLREVSLALVDKTPVCLGSPVQFRAMALPNPTFKWYKPGATDFWSEERAPVISSADWGDNGLHKVDITTSLCLTKTMTMELPVEIQEPPTLVRTGGEASQIICSGTGITDVVYTWGGSAQDVAVSGGLYSSYYVKDMTAKTLTIKGKFTNAVSYTITTVGGCEDISISGRFEMKQQPTGRILPENAVNQSICLGNPILPFTCYGLYTTTDMELTGLPDGLTIVHDQKNNQLKVSGTPTAVGVYTYTFTVRTSDPTNPCPENVYTGTITVATEDELELLSAAETEMQTLCYTSGGTITPIEYKWGGMATDVIVSGNMPESCYIKDMLNKTITINRVPISSGVITVTVSTNGGCNPKTMSFTVNVLTTPGYPILSFPSVCKGDDIFGTIIKSKQGYIYQRYDARTGGNPVGAPITGNGSDIKMNCGKMGDEENTIVYLDVTSNEGCSLTERMMIYVNRIKAFEVYPDLRIKTSCNEKPINLTKYINPEWFISIKWTPESSFEDGGDNNGVLKPDVVLDKGNTYVYNFSVTNECVTAGGKLYLSVTEPENVQSAKEVKICYENATSIYLNPIMGIEAEGEWKCIPEDANYYLDVSDYPPFENMAILNGENIWYDGGIPFIGDTKRVDVVFTPSKSCFNNAEYKLTIILTSDLSS